MKKTPALDALIDAAEAWYGAADWEGMASESHDERDALFAAARAESAAKEDV